MRDKGEINLPINSNDLLTARTVEWERLEFKREGPGIITSKKIGVTKHLLALGKTEQAFALLEQLIEKYSDAAQGYVVLAATLSMDAQRFNLRPDFDRAQQLLLQAQKNATDCADWDVEVRLQDLTDAANL